MLMKNILINVIHRNNETYEHLIELDVTEEIIQLNTERHIIR